MNTAYPPRYISECPTCGWWMQAYDYARADGAARVHGLLKEGHEALTRPIGAAS